VHKRERFVMSVRCPVCAQDGSATWEENENENLDMTIRLLSRGFRTGVDNEILCSDCGVIARRCRHRLWCEAWTFRVLWLTPWQLLQF
jgi:hypothetical protein